MNHGSLADRQLIAQDIPPQSTSANVNGAVIDMQGWDGCLYEFNLGAFTGAATLDARIVSSANANMSGATNIATAALSQVAAASNNNVALIDCYKPTDRYLRSAVVPGANAVLIASTAIRYRRSGILPATPSAIQTVKVQVN